MNMSDDKSFFLHLRLFLPYKPFGCFHEQCGMIMKYMTEEKTPTRLTNICQMHTCTEKLENNCYSFEKQMWMWACSVKIARGGWTDLGDRLTWRPWTELRQTARPRSSSPAVPAWWRGLQPESGRPPLRRPQLLPSCQTLWTHGRFKKLCFLGNWLFLHLFFHRCWIKREGVRRNSRFDVELLLQRRSPELINCFFM